MPFPASSPTYRATLKQEEAERNAEAMHYKVDQDIQVYSNSKKAWIDGKVKSVESGIVTVTYSLSGGKMMKRLRDTDKDLRVKDEA